MMPVKQKRVFPKPSVSYTLFLYREELRRRKARYIRLSKTKITLTSELISRSIRNIHACTIDDLRTVRREMEFQKQLKQQIYRLWRLKQLGIRNANPNAMSTDL